MGRDSFLKQKMFFIQIIFLFNSFFSKITDIRGQLKKLVYDNGCEIPLFLDPPYVRVNNIRKIGDGEKIKVGCLSDMKIYMNGDKNNYTFVCEKGTLKPVKHCSNLNVTYCSVRDIDKNLRIAGQDIYYIKNGDATKTFCTGRKNDFVGALCFNSKFDYFYNGDKIDVSYFCNEACNELPQISHATKSSLHHCLYTAVGQICQI